MKNVLETPNFFTMNNVFWLIKKLVFVLLVLDLKLLAVVVVVEDDVFVVGDVLIMLSFVIGRYCLLQVGANKILFVTEVPFWLRLLNCTELHSWLFESMCEILRQNQCKKLDTKSKVNAFLNLLFKIVGEMELELIIVWQCNSISAITAKGFFDHRQTLHFTPHLF